MRFLYLLIIIALATSCKTTKKSQEKLSETWTLQDFKAEKEQILPLVYATYALNKEQFSEQLVTGKIQLPQADNSLAYFQVENSLTMSEALQEKFPQLKSFKGVQLNNTLCQCRIDQNELDFKITILCNDASFYINDLYENGIYFFYNKQDLPEGVGHIKE